MSATAQQRMKLANEKAMKNINNRGNVPKSTKENPEKYPVTIVSINAVYLCVGLLLLLIVGVRTLLFTHMRLSQPPLRTRDPQPQNNIQCSCPLLSHVYNAVHRWC